MLRQFPEEVRQGDGARVHPGYHVVEQFRGDANFSLFGYVVLLAVFWLRGGGFEAFRELAVNDWARRLQRVFLFGIVDFCLHGLVGTLAELKKIGLHLIVCYVDPFGNEANADALDQRGQTWQLREPEAVVTSFEMPAQVLPPKLDILDEVGIVS